MLKGCQHEMAVFFEEPGLKGRPAIVCQSRLSRAYTLASGEGFKKIVRQANFWFGCFTVMQFPCDMAF